MFTRKKQIETTNTSQMKRHLDAKGLILLGLGSVVGTGIFVITGTAAAIYAGPALIVSFLLAALIIILLGLIYAEFASTIPNIGGAYAYTYVVLGEKIAWLVGLLLMSEFLVAGASVASGWSGYISGLLASFGIMLPHALTGAIHPAQGTYFDLIAFLITLIVTVVVCQESKKAMRMNNWMVYIKFALIALFVIVGSIYVNSTNWVPFMPFGFTGVVSGVAIVVYAFLGFDAMSMAADEVKDPQRNLPIGLVGAIISAAILYILVTVVLTGLVPFDQLNIKDPVSFAMRFVGHPILANIISVGAIIALLSVLISMVYTLSRTIYAVSKDGLISHKLSVIHPEKKIPQTATLVAGGLIMVFAACIPLDKLAEITNMTALLIGVILALALIKMRLDKTNTKTSGFKIPGGIVVAIITIIACLYLMLQLSIFTWVVLAILLAIGITIYLIYGRHHSFVK